MSTLQRPTLASLVESFFALGDNPQAKAILAVLMLSFWLWLISLDKMPTKAEGYDAARQAFGRGVVIETSQGPHGDFVLSVMSDNRLVQRPFWDYYYPLGVAADTANQLSYEDRHRLSLEAYARVGDSLVKKPGSLFVQVKRGTAIRTFYYCNPYP